jgi:hypothetical protein
MVQVADSLRLRLTEAGRVWLWLWSLEPGNVGKAGQALRGADARSNKLHQLSPGVDISH